MTEKSETEGKVWLERLVGYAVLILILGLLAYGISNSSIIHGVDEAAAVKIALDDCKYASFSMDVQEEPQHAKAELMTCGEVQKETMMSECDHRKADAKMWFVTTDGLWFLYGPAPDNGEAPIPILIDACYVLIDGTNGRRLEIRYSE